MTGYIMCEELNGIKSNIEPPFWLFLEWITRYYNHDGSYYNWDGIILLNCENDEVKALDIFFERFDEFRKFSPKSILTTKINKDNIEFPDSSSRTKKYSLTENGDLTPFRLAEQIFVVQYEEKFGIAVYHQTENEIIEKEYYPSIAKTLISLELQYGKLSEWIEIESSKFREVNSVLNNSSVIRYY